MVRNGLRELGERHNRRVPRPGVPLRRTPRAELRFRVAGGQLREGRGGQKRVQPSPVTRGSLKAGQNVSQTLFLVQKVSGTLSESL